VQASPSRCPRCAFPPELCLCPEIPRLEVPVRFLVLRHASERERLSNTARWAALALPGTEIREHGLPGATDALAPPAAEGAVVLFPSPHPSPPPPVAPRLVVVPDGTWSQARRMMQRVPALRTLPRLALPGPPAGRRLRRPHRDDGMSTLEAMAGALAALGERAAADRLLAVHAAAVERVLRLKGVWDAGCAAAAHRRGP